MLRESSARQLQEAAGDNGPPHADPHYAARMNGGALQLDRADARQWMCESNASFQICTRDQYTCRGVVGMSTQLNICDDTAQGCHDSCRGRQQGPPTSSSPWHAHPLCYQWMMTPSLGHDVSECYLWSLAWFLKNKIVTKNVMHSSKKSPGQSALTNVW